MAVELAVVLPVLLVVALFGMNTACFLAECSAFDRAFRQSVLMWGASPANDDADVQGNVARDVSQACGELASVKVVPEPEAGGLVRYRAEMEYAPKLFGDKPVEAVFGIALPKFKHEQEFVIDAYKPGVLW